MTTESGPLLIPPREQARKPQDFEYTRFLAEKRRPITAAEQRDNSNGTARLSKQPNGKWAVRPKTARAATPVLAGGRETNPDCSVRFSYHNNPDLSS
jgi:hypothetical protein